ncbi:hypothetical protein FACS1894191_1670 [Clostridia bacterium]|nr:hypothetical protein FACS1894191_1670 [Clostridia bacterium]
MNAYEIVLSRNVGRMEVLALIDPDSERRWTYREMLEAVDRRAKELAVNYARGNTLRLEGRWTVDFIFDWLASEKIGMNRMVVPSPLIPAPKEIVGYDKGGATILFTSGTSGIPKGVVQYADRFAVMQDKVEKSPWMPEIRVGELVALSLPTVIAGFIDIMRVFQYGGTVVILQGRTPDELWADIAMFKINYAIMVTSIGMRLCKIPGLDLSNLRWVVLIGEPANPKPVRLLSKALAESGCENPVKLAYGSTENGFVSAPDDFDGVAYKPFFGMKYRLVDTDENGFGNLQIYSDGTQMLEYYNNPVLTVKHFMKDGYGRTEDIARDLGNGLFRPYGRVDKRFSDGSFIFLVEERVGDIDGVFDVDIFPSLNGDYYAHTIFETGVDEKAVKAEVNTVIRASRKERFESSYGWDWYPLSVASFKRDRIKMAKDAEATHA